MILDDQNPKLITVAIYAVVGGFAVAFWTDESAWLSTASVIWSSVFFGVALVSLWDYWRVREINRRYSVAKALKEELSAAMMRDYPGVYIADKIAGMNERQVEATLVIVLPLYEDGDQMAADMAGELTRKYGVDTVRAEPMNIEDEAKIYLREAAKHGGKMRPQATVSAEKRRRLQRVLEYLESQDVIERPLYNRPVNIDWERVGKLGLLGGRRQEAL